MEIQVLSSAEQKHVLAKADGAKIKYLNYDLVDSRTYIVALNQGEVVGVVSLVDKSFRINNAIGVGFVSVHQDYKHQGIAKKLVEALFSYAKGLKKHISNTPYEPEGLLWLKPAMTRNAALNPEVLLYER